MYIVIDTRFVGKTEVAKGVIRRCNTTDRQYNDPNMNNGCHNTTGESKPREYVPFQTLKVGKAKLKFCPSLFF